jgi:hypothetical protein
LEKVIGLVFFLVMIPPSIGFSRGLPLPLAKVPLFSTHSLLHSLL